MTARHRGLTLINKSTYHHGNLREALIEAARATLAAEGLEGLSLRKVAERAEVSATALYSHFKDKRELLALLATQGFEQLSCSMQTAALAYADKEQASQMNLSGLALGYTSFALENPALFRLMFGREVGDLLEFPALVEAGAKSYAMMADCVAQQVRASGSSTSPAIAATAAWSAVHGLSTLLNDGRVSPATCGVASNEDIVLQVCEALSFNQ